MSGSNDCARADPGAQAGHRPVTLPPNDARTETSDDGGRTNRAWQWLRAELKGSPVPPVLAIIGLEQGDVLDALDRHAPGTRVLALEPDTASAQAFLSSNTWQRWRQGGRLAYLAGPDYTGADEAWRIFPDTFEALAVLVNPSLAHAPGRALQVLKKILAGVTANREARRKFAPRYLVNAIRNLPAMVAGSDVRHLADAYRGVPALVAAAGPSLDAALPQLRDVHDRALLIACDTAFRPLLASGIAPQLVVGVDPGVANARHFLSLPECANTWLVSESALDRRATAPFDRRTFWFRVSNHEPWPWLNELGLDVGKVDVWGSVLTAAFQVACLAGCDPIVVIGADLSFTNGRPYARGTTYEFDWALGTAREMAIEDAWRLQISTRKLVPVRDVQGGHTQTTTSLVSFRDWLVARAERSGRRVINATGAGILAGTGVELGTIAQALPHTITVPPVATFARRHAAVKPSKLATRVRDVHKLFVSGGSVPILARWAQFSGDGFDRAAVTAALDEAANTLETKRGKSAVTVLIPWERLSKSAAAAAILTRLPESLARLRIAMTDVDSLPAVAGVGDLTNEQRTGLLVDALSLLSRIKDELWRMDDLPPMAYPWHANQVPATAVYQWPEPLLWAVEVFEGLLGAARVKGTRSLQPAFVAGSVEWREHLDGAGDRTRLISDRPNATHACVLLAWEWIQCWADMETQARVRELLARFAGVESIVRMAAAGGFDEGSATLVLAAHAIDLDVSFELPVRLSEPALARVLTGVARTLGPDLIRVETSGMTAAMVMTDAGGSGTRPDTLHRATKPS